MTGDTRSPFSRDPRTLVLAVLAAGMLMRFLLAVSIGLGVDESYAVAVARQFSLSYFDHPPLHFWVAGAVAKMTGSEAGVVVRLPFVLLFCGTTWLMYRLGSRLFGEAAGAMAALLLNLSVVFAVTTGGWVLPDGPLMLAMLAAVTVIAEILFGEVSHPTARWALAGVLTGLALLSKYHGVFVLGGTCLFLLTSAPHRKWLRHPGPYVGALIAMVCFMPVIVWNSRHGWASFAFQGGRAAGRGGVHVAPMLANVAGQAAWVLPWIWVPLVVVLWQALRSGPRDAKPWFLACVAVLPIVAFTLVALRGEVGLPHWQAPGYLMLFPLLGAAVVRRLDRGDQGTRRWLQVSVWGFSALVVLLGTQTATGWISRAIPGSFAKGDPTADAVDWRELRPALAALGGLPRGGFVAAPSWIQAGKASVGLGPDVRVLCLCADPHHFLYLQDDRALLGADAVIVKKVKANDDVVAEFSPYFETVTPLGVVPITRHGSEVMEVALFTGRRFRKEFPTSQHR